MVAADAQRLDALWAEPSRVAASDMPWLASLVEANPASLPLWWLYLRAVQKAESPQFTQVLHRCAALSPDRSALIAWVEEPLQPVASSNSPVVSGEPVSSDSPVVSGELVSGDTPVVSGELVSGETPVVSGELVSGDTPLVSESEPQEPQETGGKKPQEPSNAEPPVRPESKATNAATLNLDALPERVREQILRARAARAQLAEVGFGSAPVQAKVEPVAAKVEPVVPKVEPVAAKVEPVVPKVEPVVPKVEPVVPKVQPVVNEPAQLASIPEPKTASPVRVLESAGRKPKSTQKTTPEIEASGVQASPEVPASRDVPASPIQSALPTSPANLSPFAQFVANLESSSGAPQGDALIDQFLAVNPRISPMAKDAPAPVVRTEPDAQVTGLVTETLARMYAEQGHVAKAIQAYEILKLRVPEKSSIFAARIEALKTK